jgi:hypothetical protein
MLLKYSKQPRVPLAVAKERALACLRTAGGLLPAHWVAAAIWPDHKMHSQGAGGAATRILKRLEKEGLARWDCDGRSWGWRLGK